MKLTKKELRNIWKEYNPGEGEPTGGELEVLKAVILEVDENNIYNDEASVVI
jgi:hypothetical protein